MVLMLAPPLESPIPSIPSEVPAFAWGVGGLFVGLFLGLLLGVWLSMPRQAGGGWWWRREDPPPKKPHPSPGGDKLDWVEREITQWLRDQVGSTQRIPPRPLQSTVRSRGRTG